MSFVPIVRLPLEDGEIDVVADACCNALRTSGFLLLESPFLTPQLQRDAVNAASNVFAVPPTCVKIEDHPTDPKQYTMLIGEQAVLDADPTSTLSLYCKALDKTKEQLLRCIAHGLGLDDKEHFVKLHSEKNNTLRLIQYLPYKNEHVSRGNRCKEHSDYGIGLEALANDNTWVPVPHREGALVVNIGSLLSKWTNGELKATIHRVAGPDSKGTKISKEELEEASTLTRTSLAFFTDPNEDVCIALPVEGSNTPSATIQSVREYLQYRSGSKGEGVAVIPESHEESRLEAATVMSSSHSSNM
eukprot:GSMAST32.ASY1.ANO1.1043.1 assembled CDS